MVAKLSGLLLSFSLAVFTPAYGHHSGVVYDHNQKVSIKGEVVEWRWSNPHAWLKLYVTGADGDKVLWSVEATSPNILVGQGWKRTSLKPGDMVEIVLYPLRDGSPGGSLVGATLSDGTVLGAPAGSGGSTNTATSGAKKN